MKLQKEEIGNIMIVDDHLLVAEGLVQIIERDHDLKVVAVATCPEEALEMLDTSKPEIVIMDISLKNANGLDLTSQLLEIQPNLLILILSMHKEELYAERSLKVGAKGYIMKETAPCELLTAIHQVLEGKLYLSHKLKEKLQHGLNNFNRFSEKKENDSSSLSEREIEILSVLGQGMKTRHIANILEISPKTVAAHYTNIKIKLGLKNSAELFKYAVLMVNKRK